MISTIIIDDNFGLIDFEVRPVSISRRISQNGRFRFYRALSWADGIFIHPKDRWNRYTWAKIIANKIYGFHLNYIA